MRDFDFSIIRTSYFFQVIIVYCIFLFWQLTDSSIFNFIFIGILCALFIINDVLGDFYLFVGMIPILSNISIFSLDIVFVFQAFAIAKILIFTDEKRLSGAGVIGFIFISFTEVFYDKPGLSLAVFLNMFLGFVYFMVFLQFFDRKIERKTLLDILVFGSVSILIIVALVSAKNGMSLASYANSTESYVRMGEGTRDLVGAMGIPTYAGYVLSGVYVAITKYRNDKVAIIMYVFAALYSIYMGLLSVSRGFIICLVVLGISIVVDIQLRRDKKKSVIIIGLLLIVAFASYIFNKDMFDNIIMKLSSRAGKETAGDNSRTRIWKDCFKYLSKHPLALFLGLGVEHYKAVGESERYGFKMSAHNLILDAIMGWGVFGTTLFALSIKSFIDKLKAKFENKLSFTFMIPTIVWFVMRMIGGAFTTFFMYMMILTGVILAVTENEGEVINEEKNRYTNVLL